MDFLSIAKDIVIDNLSHDNVSMDEVLTGVTELFSNGKSELDIGNILSKMTQNGNLKDIVNSWLGDGENASIDSDTISTIFENEKIGNFASAINVSESEAAGVLSDALPEIIDKISRGGSIMDDIGGLEGVLNFAKKIFD